MSHTPNENPVVPQATTDRVPWVAKLGFSTIAFSWVMQTMLTTWQLYYLTTFVQISVLTVTALLTIGKIAGAVATPFWGYISDRLYGAQLGRRFGRRRAVLIITIPASFIFYMLLWVPHMGVVYYLLVNVVYSIAWAGISTVQYALPAEMTENMSQRAQLVGLNQIATAIGGVALSMLNIWFFQIWGDGEWRTYFLIALIWGVVGLTVLILGFFTIYERSFDASTDVAAADGATSLSFGKRLVGVFWNFLSALRVRSYRAYLAMYLCEQTFRAIRGTINTYFVIYVLLLTPAMVSLGTGVGFVFGIAFVTMWIWLTARLDGMRTFRWGGRVCILIFALMMCLALLRGELSTGVRATAFVVLIIALNFGIAGVVNAAQFIFTMVPDVDEIVTAKRREGQYSGINSTLDVIFNAIETVIIGAVLQATGFVEGADAQPPSTVTWLMYLYCLAPIALCIMGNLVSRMLKLNRHNHDLLIAEVERLRAGGSMADATPETRAVIESLSGFAYEKCWGHNNVIDMTKRTDRAWRSSENG